MLVTTLNTTTRTHQYRKIMQHQKHQQASHYNKSSRDLPSLKTGDVVYIQLMPNVRRWIPATIVETLSARSYRVKTIKGTIYIRNRKFIRIRYTDSRQSLQTIPKDTVQSEVLHTLTDPRGPQETHRDS